MSLAEEMLANVSLDNETTAYNTDDDEHIVVSESRDIIVPNSLKVIAVTGDKDVETVTFDCVRYWDGNDLSTFAIYLNYILPDGTTGTYIPESIRTSDGESIYHFDWLIQNNITKKSGKILFGVTAIKTKQNDSGEPIIEKQWSSFVNGDCSIAVGVDVSIVQDEEESGGIIAQLSKILENVPVRGEYLQDDVYFPSNRSPDDLKSSADVGFYIGDGYSLIVTMGSQYGDYNTIHQIKIVNTYTENGTPTIYIRQYYMGSAYSGTWTDWSQVGGGTTLYEHVYTFVSPDYEEIITISWTDKYASYGSTVDTIISNLHSRHADRIFFATGYSWYHSGQIVCVKMAGGDQGFQTYVAASPSGVTKGNWFYAHTLLLDSYSDRALS